VSGGRATSPAAPDLSIDRETIFRLLIESRRRHRARYSRAWFRYYGVWATLFVGLAAIGWWGCAYRPPEFGRALPLIGLGLSFTLAFIVAGCVSFQLRRWLSARRLRGDRLRDAVRRTRAIVRHARALGTLSVDPEASLPCLLMLGGGAVFALASSAELGELLLGIPARLLMSSLAVSTGLFCCYCATTYWRAYTAVYRPPDILYLTPPRHDGLVAYLEFAWTLHDLRVVTLTEAPAWQALNGGIYRRNSVGADALRTVDAADRQWLAAELADLCSLVVVDAREATPPLLQALQLLIERGKLKRTLFVVPRAAPAALLEAAVAEGTLNPAAAIRAVRSDELVDAGFAIYPDGRRRSDADTEFRHPVAAVLTWGTSRGAVGRRWPMPHVVQTDTGRAP
jgi:hypothetical protein